MRNLKLLSLVAILLLLVILLLVLVRRNEKLDSNNITKTWLLYENKDLGVSMKYPKQIMGQDIVFFQIGDMLMVTTNNSSIYTHRNEITAIDPILIKKQIQEMKQKYQPKSFEEGWQIWVSDVNTESDLNNIIKKWFGFGDGCKIGKKVTNEINYFEVDIEATAPGEDLDSTSCPVNWVFNFIYSSEYKRSAIWDMGQDYHFYYNNTCVDKPDEHNCSADELMKDSFRFIDKN